MPARRFPPPWIVEDIGAAFVVPDHDGQQLAYRDEARRIAVNIANSLAQPDFLI